MLARGKSFAFEDRVSDEWYTDRPQPHLTQGLESVRSTVAALDRCMRKLIDVGGETFYEASGSAEVSGLVLTLLALHRLLFEYVDDLLRRFAVACGDEVSWRHVSPRLSSSHSEASVRARVVYASTGREPTASANAALSAFETFRDTESLLDLTECLYAAANQVEPDSPAARALPGPIGGIMMSLEYISRALAVANSTLDDLKKRQERRGDRLVRGIGAASLCAVVLASWRRGARSGKIAVGAATAACLFGTRMIRSASISSRLKKANDALQVALRMWSITLVTLDDGIRHTRKSYCSLLKPFQNRASPLTKRLAEAIPTPSSLCFWYRMGAPWQIALVERALRTWGASCFSATQFFGLRLDDEKKAMPIIEAAAFGLASALVPFYLCFPDLATRRAALATSRPRLRFLTRFLWYPLDSRELIFAARTLERARGLSLQTRTRIGGIECTVCAAGKAAIAWRELREAWTRDPHHLEHDLDVDDLPAKHSFDVLLHVHGGAFVSSFEAAHWRWFHELANATKNTLVIVPHYSLVPEHAYPVAVNEVHKVYDAILANDLGLQNVEAYGVKESAFYRERRSKKDDKKRKALVAEMNFDFVNAPRERRVSVNAFTASSESAGACIMASVITRIAKKSEPRKMPDALLLAYPPLNMLQCESPSRIVHHFDPLVPLNALVCVSQAYGVDQESDGSLMSYYASDDALKNFPPTLLLCGGTDPLLDEAVDFHTRLKRAQVDSHLLVHRDLTHGFLGMLPLGPFAPPHALDTARQAVRFLSRGAARRNEPG